MKKNLLEFTFFKGLLALVLLLFLPLTINAQLLLTENFEYAEGNLVGTGGWTQQPTDDSFPLQIKNNPLTYAGYQATPLGMSIYLDNKGQDAYKVFEEQTSGTVYASALINFSEVQSKNNQGEYFFHFGEGGSSVFGGRVMAKQSADGTKMLLGITRGGTSTLAVWGETEYDLNTTHLIVLKYEIVDGAKNDIVSLFVNPVISGTEPTPIAVSGTEGGADLSAVKSVSIRQGATTRTPLGYIGNIRVAKTWGELFNLIPVEKPTLTLSSKSVLFGNVFAGETHKKTINVKGANLKGDITLSGLTSGEIAVPEMIITKAQAEAEEGFDLEITLNALDPDKFMDNILLDSEDLTQAKITAYWTTTALTEVADLEELRQKFEEDQYATFKVTGSVFVSHSYRNDAGTIKHIYVQDDKSAITINNAFGDITTAYKQGDEIVGMVGTVEKSFGTTYFIPIKDFGDPASENKKINPVTATLSELAENPVKYESRLVKVLNVSFYDRENENGGIFTKGTNNKIKQGTIEATMRVYEGTDFLGEEIPESANMVGIVTAGTGKLIAPRNKTDLTAVPVITANPSTPLEFTAEVGKTQVKEVLISSSNLIDYLYTKVMGEGEGSFTTSTSMLPKENNNSVFKITFAPKKEGTFNERIALYSKDADTLFIQVTGTGVPVGSIPEGDSYPLDVTNPLTLLVENFNDVSHNTVLSIDKWKNIAEVNTRAWWGYTFKDDSEVVTERTAKVTAFNSVITDHVPYEMWLYTPALDFVNSASKMFTFRVMGDLMTEDGDAKLELYYADMADGALYKSKIEMDMPSIPDENKEWREFHINLEGQELADVFFMAFRFSATGGTANSAVYYIDDVTYGRTDIPVITPEFISDIVIEAIEKEEGLSDVVNITGTNLTEPITIAVGRIEELIPSGGGDSSMNKDVEITTTETILPATGGSFQVKAISDAPGIFQTWLKLSSRGAADIYLNVMAYIETGIGIDRIEVLSSIWVNNGKVNVSVTEESDISIYNLSGVKVASAHVNAGKIELPVQLTKGVYVVENKTANATRNVKIVIP